MEENLHKIEGVEEGLSRVPGNGIYLAGVLLCYVFLICFFCAGIRSTVSRQEGRRLSAFPEWSVESFFDGSYTEGISTWFSDTVPQRESLVSAALAVQKVKGVSLKEDGEEIRFHSMKASGEADGTEEAKKQEGKQSVTHKNEAIREEYHTAGAEDFTTVSNGIIITGTGEKTRAMMLYGGNTDVTTAYAKIVNRYKKELPGVNVYCMVIPTSIAFYCPASAEAYTGSQLDQINNVITQLSDDVVGLNVYTTLGEHRGEDIYLRTDHHWAPLGAYYAAKEFADAAGLPFLALDAYDTRVIHDYVGTMYMYAQDARIKDHPEDFVYYIPKNITLTTTYINAVLDEDWKVTGEEEPVEAPFYIKQSDGSRTAYSTFMGGDAKIAKVKTSTKGGRKLLILKDSFGNALPEFLFGSFSEIHIIDARYFIHNIKDYAKENGITDLLFANNAFHASTGSTIDAYERYLTQ